MDAIGLIIGALLNASIACSALPADEYHVQGDDFLVLNWRCEVDRATNRYEVWRSWQRKCVVNAEKSYWGRPYFLQNQTTFISIYVNRFGEMQVGVGASILDTYVPRCGS
jgi:hypothetical protein